MKRGLKISISSQQIFEFAEKVQQVMVKAGIHESIDLNARRMTVYIAENTDSSKTYRDVFFEALLINQSEDTLNYKFTFFQPSTTDNYLLGIPTGDFRDKLLELHEVTDWKYPDSEVSDVEEFQRKQDWVPLKRITNTSPPRITVQLPLSMSTYGNCALQYTPSEWEQFSQVAFNTENIFKSVAIHAAYEYFREHDISVIQRASNYRRIENLANELYQENPSCIGIPEFRVEGFLEDTPFPVIEHIELTEWFQKIHNAL